MNNSVQFSNKDFHQLNKKSLRNEIHLDSTKHYELTAGEISSGV